MSDLIDRAQAQTELQFVAKRYTVAHEAHGEGHVVWSDNLISVADAMNALRNVPSAELGTNLAEVGMGCISRQAAIKDAESWVAVDEYEKHLQKNVVKWLKEFPAAELDTNLAEVGTRAVRGYPIDADALMKKVAEEYGERARDTLYRIIRYMPPARPEPKRGKWINGYCSECGEHAPYWAMASAYHTTNFCPNCGADMREVTT